MSQQGHAAEWGPILPFWIDTPGYSRRDRQMFVAGVEFLMVTNEMRHQDGEHRTTVSRENTSRLRMAAGQLGRRVVIDNCEPCHDPDGHWAYLTILPRSCNKPATDG